MLRLCPIGKHNRNGRENLHIYVIVIALFDSLLRIPAITFNLTKKFVIHHHLGFAIGMVFQVNEATIAKLLTPSWHFLRDDVRMNVNLLHEGKDMKLKYRV